MKDELKITLIENDVLTVMCALGALTQASADLLKDACETEKDYEDAIYANQQAGALLERIANEIGCDIMDSKPHH